MFCAALFLFMANNLKLGVDLEFQRTNIKPIVNDVQRQLSGIEGTVRLKVEKGAVQQIGALNQRLQSLNKILEETNVRANVAAASVERLANAFNSGLRDSAALARNTGNVVKSMQEVSRGTETASNSFQSFGRSVQLAAKRFTAFTIGAGALIGFIRSLEGGVRGAVEFQKEMIRLAQVAEEPASALRQVQNEITRLSTSLGVSSTDLAKTAVTLKQAGLSLKDVNTSLEAIAEASLAPNFKDMNEIVEGSIAIFSQFETRAEDLKGVLGSLNAVAGAFAVESSDLVTLVRKTGGAFKSAGGDLNELLALFTSVRATTRESADSIATGFRTIFGRLQRPETIEDLKQLGIELRFTRGEAEQLGNVNLTGQFVGAFEAVRRLSTALRDIPTTDQRFAQVVESIGGIRQISKVIPLIQQFSVSNKALAVALSGTESLSRSTAIAQESLTVKVTKLQEAFAELFRSIADSSGFRAFVDSIVTLGVGLAKVLDFAKPLIPLLTTLATVKIASNIGDLLRGARLFGAPANATQVPPKKFARGGFVPGVGNGDTVPAMLEPGEFVLRKSAVEGLKNQGVNLNGLNRFGIGGKVKVSGKVLDIKPPQGRVGILVPNEGFNATKRLTLGQSDMGRGSIDTLKKITPDAVGASVPVVIKGPSGNKANSIKEEIDKSIIRSAANIGQTLLSEAPKFKFNSNDAAKITKNVIGDNARGQIFEAILQTIVSRGGGDVPSNNNDPFDFAPVDTKGLDSIYNVGGIFADAKISASEKNINSVVGKAVRQFARDDSGFDAKLKTRTFLQEAKQSALKKPVNNKIGKAFGGLIQKFAAGGLAKSTFLSKAKNARSFGTIFDAPETLVNKIPSDAQYLGSGMEAVVFKSNSGRVFRLGQHVTTGDFRPKHKDVLQAFNTYKEGDYILEELPFAPSLQDLNVSSNRKGIIEEAIANRLLRQGLIPTDVHAGNIGRDEKGKIKLIDPTTFKKPETKEDFDKLAKLQKIYLGQALSTERPLNTQISGPSKFFGGLIHKFANGGASPTDTVPALLTPGEFVINKDAAGKIGNARLNRLNKGEVEGFAKGGPVGSIMQRFEDGGEVDELAEVLRRRTNTPRGTPSEDRLAGNVSNFSKQLNQTADALIRMQQEVDNNTQVVNSNTKAISLPGPQKSVQTSPNTDFVNTPTDESRREELNRRGGVVKNLPDNRKVVEGAKKEQLLRVKTAEEEQALLNKRIAAETTRNAVNNQASLTGQVLSVVETTASRPSTDLPGPITRPPTPSGSRVNALVAGAQAQQLRPENLRQNVEVIDAQRKIELKQAGLFGAIGITLRDQLPKITKPIGDTFSGIASGLRETFGRADESESLDPEKLAKNREKNARRDRIANTALLFAGTGTTIASAIADRAGPANASSGAGFRAAQGVSGAFAGAAQGAALGSIFGPWGVAIGGATGALVGLTTALKEAEKSILGAKLDEGITQLNTKLQNAEFKIGSSDFKDILSNISERRSEINNLVAQDETVGSQGFFTGVQKKTTELLAPAASGITQGLLKNVEEIGSAFRGLDAVGNDEAAQRKAIAEEISRANPEFKALTQEISNLTKQSVTKLNKAFIDTALIAARANQRRQAQAVVDARVGSVSQFADAMESASRNVDVFARRLDAIGSIIDGNFTNIQTRSFSEDVGTFGLPGNSRFSQGVDTLLEPFGNLADPFKQQLKAFDKIAAVLPQAVVEGTNKFTEGRDTGDVIKEAIKNLLGPEQSQGKEIQSALNLLGSQFSDIFKLENLREKLGAGDVSGISKEALKFLEPLKTNVAELAKVIDAENKRIADVLSSYRQTQEKIIASQDRVSDATLERDRTIAEIQAQREGRRAADILGTRNTFDEKQGRLLAGTGLASTDAAGIGEALRNTNKELLELQGRRDKDPSNIELTKQFTEVSNRAGNLNKALQNLTDTSSRSAAIQARLNDLQQRREARTNIADTFATGSAEDKFNLLQGLSDAGTVKGLQGRERENFIQGLDGERLKNLLRAAEQVRGEDGAGNLRNEILQSRLQLPQGFLLPGETEDALQQELIKVQQAAVDASNQLTNTLVQNAQTQKASIDKFINALLTDRENRFLGLQRDTKLGQVAPLEKQKNDLTTIQKGFGDLTKKQLENLKNPKNLEAIKILQETDEESKRLSSIAKSKDQFRPEFITTVGKDDLGFQEQSKDFTIDLAALKRDAEARLGSADLADKFIASLSPALTKTFNIGDFAANRGEKIRLNQVEKTEKIDEAFKKFALERSIDAGIEVQRGKTRLGITGDLNAESVKALQGLDLNSLNNGPLSTNISNLDASIKGLKDEIANLTAKMDANTGKPVLLGQGIETINRANGGSIFKPKGTDTVPAMLTPGEFVVNAKATAQHKGLLEKINAGYFAGGGFIGGDIFNFGKRKLEEMSDPFAGGIRGGGAANLQPIDKDKLKQAQNIAGLIGAGTAGPFGAIGAAANDLVPAAPLPDPITSRLNVGGGSALPTKPTFSIPDIRSNLLKNLNFQQAIAANQGFRRSSDVSLAGQAALKGQNIARRLREAFRAKGVKGFAKGGIVYAADGFNPFKDKDEMVEALRVQDALASGRQLPDEFATIREEINANKAKRAAAIAVAANEQELLQLRESKDGDIRNAALDALLKKGQEKLDQNIQRPPQTVTGGIGQGFAGVGITGFNTQGAGIDNLSSSFKPAAVNNSDITSTQSGRVITIGGQASEAQKAKVQAAARFFRRGPRLSRPIEEIRAETSALAAQSAPIGSGINREIVGPQLPVENRGINAGEAIQVTEPSRVGVLNFGGRRPTPVLKPQQDISAARATSLLETSRKAEIVRQERERRKRLGLSPIGFAEGGSVPAMVSPGESITRNTAIGSAINSNRVAYLATGGQAGGTNTGSGSNQGVAVGDFNKLQQIFTGFASSSEALVASMTTFNSNAQRLSDALSAFPQTISMEGRHTVEVIINGADAFTKIQPELKEFVTGEIKSSLRKLVKEKFPDAGTVGLE